MNYVAEIATIETCLKRAGMPVAEMLRHADVSPSQWQRWKSGNQKPHRTTWSRILGAINELAIEVAA